MQNHFFQTGVKSLLAVATMAAAMSASADPATITAIFGNSVGSNGWTAETSTESNLTLALRARLRLPTATNIVNTDGNGNYFYNAGAYSLYGFNTLAEWNFDFSISNGNSPVDNFTYVLGIDLSPSAVGTPTYSTIDPLAAFADNSFGTSATGTGGGVEAGNGVTKEELAAANSIAQNSQNFGWLTPLFDPTVAGTYSIYLAAFNNAGQQVARTDINVIVASVPEPASLALVGIAGLGMIGVARRRSRA